MAIARSKILKVTICFWALYVYTSVCMWNTDLSRWKRYQKFTPVIWRVAICPKVLQTYSLPVNQKTAFLFNFQRLLSRQHSISSLKVFICNFCLSSNASLSWLGTSFFPRVRHLWIRCMKDKTNSQVWKTSIIPCLIKSTKNINQDRFGNVGSRTFYSTFIRQKNTRRF